MAIHSGPVPVFLRIMTSENEGLREKRFNRGCSGPGCTRIPTGGFGRGITAPSEYGDGSGPDHGTRLGSVYEGAGMRIQMKNYRTDNN